MLIQIISFNTKYIVNVTPASRQSDRLGLATYRVEWCQIQSLGQCSQPRFDLLNESTLVFRALTLTPGA